MGACSKIDITNSIYYDVNYFNLSFTRAILKQGRKRLLDTPKRMIEREWERGERDRERM